MDDPIDPLYEITKIFSSLNLSGRCYMRLLKGIDCDEELLAILNSLGAVVVYKDLLKLLNRFGVTIEYGRAPVSRFHSNDLIKVVHRGNVVCHEIKCTGIIKHVTRKSYKFVNGPRGFVPEAHPDEFLIGLDVGELIKVSALILL